MGLAPRSLRKVKHGKKNGLGPGHPAESDQDLPGIAQGKKRNGT